MQEFIEKVTDVVEEKIKVTSLEIIVTGTKDKPYFQIKYKEVGKEDYNIGYGSYELNYVFGWKEKCFEIVNQLAEEYKQCNKPSCKDCEVYDKEKHYCPKWCEVIKHTTSELAEEHNNGWIPCSERLPRIGEQVMVCNRYGSVFVSHITYLNPRVDKNGECHDFGSHYKVIAWQPLPPAFKPKGE